MTLSLFDRLLAAAPSYCKVEDDGEKYICADCECEIEHSEALFTCTPNKLFQLLCKDCIDDNWRKNATFINEKI